MRNGRRVCGRRAVVPNRARSADLIWPRAFEAPLTVNAHCGGRTRLETLRRNLATAFLTRAVLTRLTRPHGRFDLLGLVVDELTGGLLKLALVGEVGHISGML